MSSSALVRAAAVGDVAAIRRLTRDDPGLARGWKPIMDAAFAGQAAAVVALLDAGADADIVSANSHRHTPLVRAVEWKRTIPRHAGHREVVEVLLARGADPARSGGLHQWTPFAHAAMSDEAGLVEVLAASAPDNLWHAAMRLDPVAVRRHLRRVAADARDAVGRNALHYLAASGLFRRHGSEAANVIADLLLAAGADINAAQSNIVEDGFVARPIWWAVGWQAHAPLVAHLLARGAIGQECIFAAIHRSAFDLLGQLVAHGASLDHAVDGLTPLHELLKGNRPGKAVAWLVAHGADVNVRGRGGAMSLHFAAEGGVRPEVVALLRAHGARVDVRDDAGRRPVDVARASGHDRLLSLLDPTTCATVDAAPALAPGSKRMHRGTARPRAKAPLTGRRPSKKAR